MRRSPTPVKAAAERLGTRRHRRRAPTLVGDGLRARRRRRLRRDRAAERPRRASRCSTSTSRCCRAGAAPRRSSGRSSPGTRRTGVCVMGLEPTLDTGPVYATRRGDVDDKDLDELRDELVALGATLLVGLLEDGLAGPAGCRRPSTASRPTRARSPTTSSSSTSRGRPREVARVVRLGRARTWARRAPARRPSRRGRRRRRRRARRVRTATSSPAATGGLRLLRDRPRGASRDGRRWSWRRGLRDAGRRTSAPGSAP